MDTTLSLGVLMSEQDRRITETVSREGARLRNFIRRRVANTGDAEDILQDVLYEVTVAYRLPEPIEQIGAWMYRVALNRITDLFRKNKPELLEDVLGGAQDEQMQADLMLEDLLPSADAGPEAAYARAVLLEELTLALDELTPEQRDVFIAHELEGRSFKELAAESGVSVNTLLSRKRYAVQQLRLRLQAIYDEFI
jgi:RNA polymerase sigma factor (sigma-70 family)